jgi:hypothetical protein
MVFPSGPARIVDQSEVFLETPNGTRVFSLVRRVVAPARYVTDARAMLGDFADTEVVALETLQ